MSPVEAIANVAVGYGLAVLTQILVFPILGLRTSLTDDLTIASVFTLVSLARCYALRRVFEVIRVRGMETANRRAVGPAALVAARPYSASR